MKKTCQQIEINTFENHITLSQEEYGTEGHTIVIDKDQIDMIMNWLEEATKEMDSGK